jgi:Sec-independent protein secretion pathway component TatC
MFIPTKLFSLDTSMNINLLKEIKYRCFLIFLNWFFLTNVFYLHKEILLFIIFKNLNYFNNTDFYLVYTNVTELFTIYIKLVNFCSLEVSFGFFLYHVLVFCIPTLYKNEFRVLTSWSLFFTALNLIYFIVFSKGFNVLILFLKDFQEPYVYFEIKVNEILNFVVELFFHFQVVFTSMSFLVFFCNLKLFRHFYYFILVLEILFYSCTFISLQDCLCLIVFIIIFEFLAFVLIVDQYKNKIRIK